MWLKKETEGHNFEMNLVTQQRWIHTQMDRPCKNVKFYSNSFGKQLKLISETMWFNLHFKLYASLLLLHRETEANWQEVDVVI